MPDDMQFFSIIADRDDPIFSGCGLRTREIRQATEQFTVYSTTQRIRIVWDLSQIISVRLRKIKIIEYPVARLLDGPVLDKFDKRTATFTIIAMIRITQTAANAAFS